MGISAQQEQFERYLNPQVYQRAWNYACRLSPTREDAEDLLQDALAKAYRGIDGLREPDRFGAWLLTIIRNSFLSRRRPDHILLNSYWHELVAAEEPENPLAVAILGALDHLAPDQRELISLFYLDGLSLKETGWVLGLEPPAVGQRLHRARRALRKVLVDTRILGPEPQRCRQ
ncbi:sigma-70 family RNA polymerase sigma factor [bacterium]|nr:sigma-70 family RNA polymerase sigma factor [bacterium]